VRVRNPATLTARLDRLSHTVSFHPQRQKLETHHEHARDNLSTPGADVNHSRFVLILGNALT
jgi:hypothetical protein